MYHPLCLPTAHKLLFRQMVVQGIRATHYVLLGLYTRGVWNRCHTVFGGVLGIVPWLAWLCGAGWHRGWLAAVVVLVARYKTVHPGRSCEWYRSARVPAPESSSQLCYRELQLSSKLKVSRIYGSSSEVMCLSLA